uniref:Uncharacterized protein n=1 Tax=mine drainage metagenome TaxID=410659 RepID=E6QM08_9ZZZZ
MTNDPFYLIGRRVGAKPVTDSRPYKSKPTANLRAEDSGSIGKVRVLGWSAATFGAGAILGWFAGARGGK